MTAWLVAQLGARMHYAVPRILNSAGMLEALCTDVCAGRWAEPLSRLPAGLLPAGIERLAGRVPSGLPRRLIRTFPLFGLGYAARRAAARTPAAMTAVHLWAGSAFCDAIVREGLGKAGAVYTFNSAGLGLLNQARELGLATVVEQTIARRRSRMPCSPRSARRFRIGSPRSPPTGIAPPSRHERPGNGNPPTWSCAARSSFATASGAAAVLSSARRWSHMASMLRSRRWYGRFPSVPSAFSR